MNRLTRWLPAPWLWRRMVLPRALMLGACSCGETAERLTPDPGCSDEPLVLGMAQVAGPELQVVWTGENFAVAWIGPAGYEVRLLDGARVVATRTLAGPAAEANSRPQLLWNESRLKLYYPRMEVAWMDVLDEELEVSESAATLLPEVGFRAVPLDANRVALRGPLRLVVDESLHEAPFLYAGALGYNGKSLLASSVLGHGEWNFRGSGLHGEHMNPAFDFSWLGVGQPGSAGGSALASSYQNGRHAAVVAASSVLTVLIEGAPPVERALAAELADASMFWDGKEYVVVFADGSSAQGAEKRDIRMLPVSAEGVTPAIEDAAVLSAHTADERFPVGAAAGPGDYGIAWVRGAELVFRSCVRANDERSP